VARDRAAGRFRRRGAVAGSRDLGGSGSGFRQEPRRIRVEAEDDLARPLVNGRGEAVGESCWRTVAQ
jgi:hypothetical protein